MIYCLMFSCIFLIFFSIEESMMDNVYVHLVNNSIGKHSDNFSNDVAIENGISLKVHIHEGLIPSLI